VEILNHTAGQASLGEGLGDLLDDGRCLGRRLEDDRVAGEQRGYQGVDENEIWVLAEAVSGCSSRLTHPTHPVSKHLHSTQR
jgi:hypothetical protein